MKKDDELHEVGIGLLPERLLALAEEIVEQRGDAVSKSVGVLIVVEGVVTIGGFEADLNVVLWPPVPCEDGLHLAAKVALDLEHQPADFPFLIECLVREDLIGEREYAAAGLAASYGSENGNTCEQAALGNGGPPG